jgi:hypothetical protein
MIPKSTPEPVNAAYCLRLIGHQGDDAVWENLQVTRVEFIALKQCLMSIRGESEPEAAFTALEAAWTLRASGRAAALAILEDTGPESLQ